MLGHNRAHDLTRYLLVLAALLFTLPRSGYAQATNPFLGSVPTGQASSTTLELSLKEAFARSLKYNLGAIESEESAREARAVRLRNMNALLPNLSARVGGEIEQI